MKKKIWIPIIAVIVLAILFVPIPTIYKDGGTREFTALTYKIVDWNRMTGDSTYKKTKIYPFPYNFKSIDGLWYYEEDKVEYSFNATVLDINSNSVIVKPFVDELEIKSADQISFGISELPKLDVKVGDAVKVTYTGGIMESYPAHINAVKWEKAKDLRNTAYTEQWLEKNDANKWKNNRIFDHIVITKIYSNCFFASTVIPMPYEIKLNGELSDEWCVGDQITCTYENTYYDQENNRIEADMLTVKASDWQPDPFKAYKPVIYLYPENETDVSVKLTLNGKLTCTYPEYKDGWKVTASPDGTLTDVSGKTYNYLYWEGDTYANYDLTKGFCIKGEDTALFLEDALQKLGLNRREANEFIIFWLPQMQDNPYNIISFQTDIYTDSAKLDINPTPDTLIRVFMAWQKADSYVALEKPELIAPQRSGFTAVEWGGTEIK